MKEMREIIKNLRVWLKNVDSELSNFTKELSNFTKYLDPSDENWGNIEALMQEAQTTMSNIDSHAEGLVALSKSPPGMFSALVDFLYQMTYDPNAASEKQKYEDKIRKIDMNFTNSKLTELSRAMGLPPNRYKEISTELSKEFSTDLDQLSREKLQSAISNAVSAIVTTTVSDQTDLPQFSYASEELSDVLPKDRFAQLRQDLKNRLKQTVPQDRFYQQRLDRIEKNTQRLQHIEEQQQSTVASIRYASDIKIQDLQQWIQLFQKRQKEAQQFIRNIAVQIQRVKDSEEAESATRYYNYIKGLLGEDNQNSITRSLNNLTKKLQNLIENVSIDTQNNIGEESSPEQQEEEITAFNNKKTIFSFTRKLGGTDVRD